jgi:hypothetical protein
MGTVESLPLRRTPEAAFFTAEARRCFLTSYDEWFEAGNHDPEELFARFERKLIDSAIASRRTNQDNPTSA